MNDNKMILLPLNDLDTSIVSDAIDSATIVGANSLIRGGKDDVITTTTTFIIIIIAINDVTICSCDDDRRCPRLGLGLERVTMIPVCSLLYCY